MHNQEFLSHAIFALETVYVYSQVAESQNSATILFQLGAPKHRSVWFSYLNFSIYATSVLTCVLLHH